VAVTQGGEDIGLLCKRGWTITGGGCGGGLRSFSGEETVASPSRERVFAGRSLEPYEGFCRGEGSLFPSARCARGRAKEKGAIYFSEGEKARDPSSEENSSSICRKGGKGQTTDRKMAMFLKKDSPGKLPPESRASSEGSNQKRSYTKGRCYLEVLGGIKKVGRSSKKRKIILLHEGGVRGNSYLFPGEEGSSPEMGRVNSEKSFSEKLMAEPYRGRKKGGKRGKKNSFPHYRSVSEGGRYKDK